MWGSGTPFLMEPGPWGSGSTPGVQGAAGGRRFSAVDRGDVMAIRIHQATDPETRERVFRFRYAVHVVELGKDGPGVDHARRVVTDAADEDAVIFYAEDGDRMVGTVRGNWGALGPLPQMYRDMLETAPAEAALGRQRVGVSSRLMVDPSYRGRTLASLLVLGQYDYGLSLGTTVNFTLCEVPLLRLYYRLGYRTYRPAIRPDRGLRVPLALCARDYDYLRRVRSPFLFNLPESLDDRGDAAAALAAAYPTFRAEPPPLEGDLRTLWAALADGLTRNGGRRSLFDGLEPEQIDRVFSKSAALSFQRGEVIRRRDDTTSGLGVVLSGRLGVGLPTHDGWHWLELLGPGDVFGQPEPLPGGQATDVVALEDAATALLDPNLIQRIARAHPESAIQLATNLVAVLHQRVDDLHRRSADQAVRERDKLIRAETIPPVEEGKHVRSTQLH